MFWRKKQAQAVAGQSAATVAAPAAKAAVKQPEVKQLSPKEQLTGRISQLAHGESLVYVLADTYGGGLAIIELNPKFPGKGKKYIMVLEALVKGQPGGKRNVLWDSSNPKDMANWILDRNGRPFEIEAAS